MDQAYSVAIKRDNLSNPPDNIEIDVDDDYSEDYE